MAYYTDDELLKFGFKYCGTNVKISNKASIYNPELIEIGNHSRIDDFCVISGNLKIGCYVHITPMCLVAGGIKGVVIEDFVTLAYGVRVFSQSDDYSGETMTNSNVPAKYKNEIKEAVFIGKHCIVGVDSIVFPGVQLRQGTSVGAMSLVLKSTEEWSIYFGSPAKKIKDRRRDMLELEKQFLEELNP